MRDPKSRQDTTRSGLTTDDLAHPRTTGKPPEDNGVGERPPPTFPGEATDLPGNSTGAPAERRDRPAGPRGAEQTTRRASTTEPMTEREPAADREPAAERETTADRGPVAERETTAEPEPGADRGPAADRGPVAERETTAEPEPGADREPGAEPESEAPAATEGRPGPDRGTPLIAVEDAESYRDRWQQIQANFIDDPRDSVRAADSLVADVIQTLAATFADHKQDLESRWSRGEETETEDLRVALQHYRIFFNQLLDA
ncbi:hypothetical protein [Streptomyces marianii]|uniref:Uncharacterized protein n=1 Tax=Streptomyces marianii TaxID=1817406 RepID=A0A5R9E9C9_9ACTN|nr:hypothetical protein [Streptomyces marianii]TLQ46608.1 hypothetical protein FEF34_29780 [Streptomyces marianii]